MDFSTFEIIEEKVGKYISTTVLEPDPVMRHQKYPFIDEIQQNIYIYKKPDGKLIKRTLTNNKSTAKSMRLKERYNNFKPFGLEKELNLIPTIDNEIFITKSYDNTNIKPNTTTKNITDNNDTKLYIVDKNKIIEQNFNSHTDYNNEFKKSGYIPEFMNEKLKEQINIPYFKLVLKNIPTYYSVKDMEIIIKNTFKKFGDIKKIKLLKNFNDENKLIKDICFLEFEFLTDAQKLFESNEKFIIDNSVLLIEKSKN